MSGSTDDQESSPKEDTLRETPVAKASEGQISVRPAEWEPPRRKSALAFEGARVHAFEVKGPLAWLLAIVVLVVVALFFTLAFAFAVGIGAALAVSAAVAGALGMGVRRLTSSRRKLPPSDHDG